MCMHYLVYKVHWLFCWCHLHNPRQACNVAQLLHCRKETTNITALAEHLKLLEHQVLDSVINIEVSGNTNIWHKARLDQVLC